MRIMARGGLQDIKTKKPELLDVAATASREFKLLQFRFCWGLSIISISGRSSWEEIAITNFPNIKIDSCCC